MWFDEYTDLAFHSIPGYTLISDAYRISSHCGLAIYIYNDFSYERKFINNTLNEAMARRVITYILCANVVYTILTAEH